MALTNGKGLSCLLCCRQTRHSVSCSVWGLLSHCRASGVSAVIIYPSFKSVKPRHSDSVLDQVNKYLTYPESYFNVAQTPVIPRGSSSRRRSCLCKLGFRQDDTPVSSHKLFTSTQWTMSHWSSSKQRAVCAVSMHYKALYFSHLTQHGI